MAEHFNRGRVGTCQIQQADGTMRESNPFLEYFSDDQRTAMGKVGTWCPLVCEFVPVIVALDDHDRFRPDVYGADIMRSLGFDLFDGDEFKTDREWIVWDFSGNGGSVLGWPMAERPTAMSVRWVCPDTAWNEPPQPPSPESAEQMWAIHADFIEAGAQPIEMLVAREPIGDPYAEVIRQRYATDDEAILIAPHGQAFRLARVGDGERNARFHPATGAVAWGPPDDGLTVAGWTAVWSIDTGDDTHG